MAPEAIPFPYLGPDDLRVSVRTPLGNIPMVRDVDYALTGDGADQRGSIVPLRVFAAGHIVEVLRRTRAVQDTQIKPQQPFPAVSAERTLDRGFMSIQEAADDIADVEQRALMAGPDETLAAMGPLSTFRGKVIGIGADNNPVPVAVGDANDPGLRVDLAQNGIDLIGDAGRGLRAKLNENPSIEDRRFGGGAVGDAIVDNRSALSAAFDAQNSGYKNVPPGIYSTGKVTVLLAPGAPHHIDGAGQGVSVFRKIADDPAIILDLVGDPKNLDNYTVVSNVSFDNGFRSINGTGLRLTDTARGALSNTLFDGLGTGLYARGALLMTNTGVTFRSCARGFVAERGPAFDPGDGSTAYIYPNMTKFIGGAAHGCTLIGFDVNHASGFGLIGTNIELCGTAGDLTTGGIMIRSQIAAETGFSTMSINGHIERCRGFGGILGVSLTGLILHIWDSDFVSNEAAQDMNISGATSIGLTSNSANGVTRIQARMSYVMGGFYNTLVDTSDDWLHHTETADGKRVMWMSQFRVNHNPADPTANDTIFAPGNRTRLGGAARDTHMAKYGPGLLRMGGLLNDVVALSSEGISFLNRAHEGVVAPPQPSPPPATSDASTRDLVNAIRTRMIALGFWD